MAEDGPTYFYEFGPAYESEKITFEKAEDLAFWADQFRQAWTPILSLPINKIHQAIRNSYTFNINVLNQLLLTATQYAAEPTPERKNALDKAMRNFTIRRLPLSPSAFPELFSDLLRRHSENVAASAFAGFGDLHNSPLDLTDQDVRLGLFATSAFRLRVNAEAATAAIRRSETLAGQFENDLSKLNSKVIEFEETAAAAVATAAEEAKLQRTRDRQEIDQSVAEFDITANDAISSIKATEAAYNEQMKLQASVAYWGSSAERHRQSEKHVRRILIGYAIVTVPSLVLIAFVLTAIASAEPSALQTVGYIKYGAIGLLVTTIAFWIGRLLLKIMLSERHLAIDSEERITMVQTYLALTKEDKLDKADRSLALAALFRSGSDGIVKDDAAPDTASIISRMQLGR